MTNSMALTNLISNIHWYYNKKQRRSSCLFYKLHLVSKSHFHTETWAFFDLLSDALAENHCWPVWRQVIPPLPSFFIILRFILICYSFCQATFACPRCTHQCSDVCLEISDSFVTNNIMQLRESSMTLYKCHTRSSFAIFSTVHPTT